MENEVSILSRRGHLVRHCSSETLHKIKPKVKKRSLQVFLGSRCNTLVGWSRSTLLSNHCCRGCLDDLKADSDARID